MNTTPEERAASVARWWRVLHPPLSWTLGAILLTAVTLTGVGQQQPEWYPIIGGLLGGPFLTIWNESRKKEAKKKDDS